MMRVVKKVEPPTGWRRCAYRLPIYLYRIGLGWIFGKRLMLLRHIGRVSGRRRSVVLEVVESDSATGSFVVASGWGRTAAWYRNILETPEVTIQVGCRARPATALPLGKDEGAAIFVDYAARHSRAATRLLPRLMGYSVDGSEADFREVGQQIPFVRLIPRQ